MLIKCAGYMWHRRHIDWTRRKLVGLPEQGSTPEVDFAEESAIYGLYSANHDCIYIGQAGRGTSASLFDRLKAHAAEDELFCLWERFTWFGFYSPEQLRKGKFPDPVATDVALADLLDAIESIGIYLCLTRFNRRWGTGLTNVAWYYQEAEYHDAMNRGGKK